MSIPFDPASSMLGGYHEFDGVVEFYGRIAAILKPEFVVLDLGAGRGVWWHVDQCEHRKALRDLRSRVRRVIGADTDPVVLDNPSTSENIVITGGRVPLPDQSVDVIIANYVFEHVENPEGFCREINRLLRPGGYVCARTPHKCHYVSIAARCIADKYHATVLSHAQPARKAGDVFPTYFRLNTLRSVREHFAGYENYTYLYANEPQYFFQNKTVYRLFSLLHRLLPKVFVSNIFVFVRKPHD